MVRALRTRGRTLAAAALFCLTIFYLAGHLAGHDGTGGGGAMRDKPRSPTMAVLKAYMDVRARSRRPPALVKSSVDWGRITPRHPPEHTPRPVPAPAPRQQRLPRVQHRFDPEPPRAVDTRQKRQRAVRALTSRCWAAYRKYAWRKDALMPLSSTGRDQFSGWAATLVDSLDTLWIMGLRDEFDEAVAAVAEIDFGRAAGSSRVNTFETNIRYLGGLLAAYDLSGRDVLLRKAVELGDLLYGGFDTPNRMPVDFIDIDAAAEGRGLVVEDTVVSASPGTLTLELTRLSQLTGNPRYYSAVARVTDLFYRGQNRTAIPGLFPMWVSMSREDVTTGNTFTLGGCADSLYEYFPKMHALLSGAEPQYAALTTGFLDAAKARLFFRPMLPDDAVNADILISGNANVETDGIARLDSESEHLTCFIGGTVALAGRLLGRDDDVDVGARLARGCAYAYHAFPTGVMPERYNMVPCNDDGAGDVAHGRCRWDERRWADEATRRPEYKKHLPRGFTTAKDPRYILRPEAIESVFYLWRITGDAEWTDAAWRMFEAVANATTTQIANAAVRDVTVAEPSLVTQEDYMEVYCRPSPPLPLLLSTSFDQFRCN